MLLTYVIVFIFLISKTGTQSTTCKCLFLYNYLKSTELHFVWKRIILIFCVYLFFRSMLKYHMSLPVAVCVVLVGLPYSICIAVQWLYGWPDKPGYKKYTEALKPRWALYIWYLSYKMYIFFVGVGLKAIKLFFLHGSDEYTVWPEQCLKLWSIFNMGGFTFSGSHGTRMAETVSIMKRCVGFSVYLCTCNVQ